MCIDFIKQRKKYINYLILVIKKNTIILSRFTFLFFHSFMEKQPYDYISIYLIYSIGLKLMYFLFLYLWYYKLIRFRIITKFDRVFLSTTKDYLIIQCSLNLTQELFNWLLSLYFLIHKKIYICEVDYNYNYEYIKNLIFYKASINARCYSRSFFSILALMS